MPRMLADPTRTRREPLTVLRFPRADLVRPALEALVATADRRAALSRDPLGLVHRYSDAKDRELVGLVASAVAYGRVDLFRPRLASLLDVLGDRPAALVAASGDRELLRACEGFHYRMTGPSEIAALLAAGARLQAEYGSIGAALEGCWEASDGHLREALDRFVNTLWSLDLRPWVKQRTVTRRLAHLVASPGRASACKRLNLYVRWMVRGPDGVDLGLWRLPAAALIIPLDTHVARISRLLGLTERTDLSWRTAEEITARLRHLDPVDPVKYDFALSHLGISGRCSSRRTAACEGCPLRPICRVWDVRSGSRGRAISEKGK